MSWICKKCGKENPDFKGICEACQGQAPQLLFMYEVDLVYNKIRLQWKDFCCKKIRIVCSGIDEDVTGRNSFDIKFDTIGYSSKEGTKEWKGVKIVATNEVAERTVLDSNLGVSKSLLNIQPYLFSGLYNSYFNNCNLVQITVPEGVEEIKDSLFKHSEHLRTIILPDSLKSIGSRAFQDCSKLENVVFSNTECFYSVYYSAFENCTSLRSVSLPESTNKIYYSAFKNSSLCYFRAPRNLTSLEYESFAGCRNLSVVDFNTYSQTKTSGILEHIGYRAFSKCKSLQHIILPESLKEIGLDAFEECSSLRTAFLPGSLKIVGSLFKGCTSLHSIIISEGVEKFANDAFAGLQSLKKITLPNSLEEIGEGAFWGCESLHEIMIPNSVNIISGNPFNHCSKVESIAVSEDNHIYDSRENCNAIIESNSNKLISGCKNTTIPNSVETIEECSFGGQTQLRCLIIPDSVKQICISPYVGFINDKNSVFSLIKVSDKNPVYDSRNDCNAIIETATDKLILGCNSTVIPDTVKSIGHHAFAGCSSLKELVIPDSVTEIGEYAFEDCISLSYILIPASLTSINDSFANSKACFPYLEQIMVSRDNPIYDSRDNCNAIIVTKTNILIFGCKTTIIPDGVEMIGHHAFTGCSGLTEIIIPNSVKAIGAFSFWGCDSLKSITIPPSVKRIYAHAFDGCDSLEEIVMPSKGIQFYGEVDFLNKISYYEVD